MTQIRLYQITSEISQADNGVLMDNADVLPRKDFNRSVSGTEVRNFSRHYYLMRFRGEEV